jgi:hypothetical protein
MKRSTFNMDHVQGYNITSPFFSSAYAFDSMYSDELPKQHVVQEEQTEQTNQPVPKENIYSIIEKFDPPKTVKPIEESYIELAIYIISGIFLIFMMEQILQIGHQLR